MNECTRACGILYDKKKAVYIYDASARHSKHQIIKDAGKSEKERRKQIAWEFFATWLYTKI
jgi:hypothetical protein